MVKNGNRFDSDEAKAMGLITTGYHLPYNPKLTERAKELRNNLTEAEKRLWYGYLCTFKYPISRQRPIDNYIVDFYCPTLKLVIEVDGDAHSSEEGKVYDEVRTEILTSYGLTVIRFNNKDIMENFEGVCRKIDKVIPPTLCAKEG